MRLKLMVVYDNPPSYRGRSLWSTPEEFEANRLWLTREVHEIISFPIIREKITGLKEVFVYNFEDIQAFSYPASYFISDYPAYIRYPLCNKIINFIPEIIIVAGRKAVCSLVERYCQKIYCTVRVVWVRSPLQCRAVREYERQDILRKIEEEIGFCNNARYSGST
ncbi:MAG: hypothetical protein HYT98_01165 [Candidatus Sungbacteria bacterium]|nr:hypothetical protein [Candidatus Sungbacteria bacterium]